MIRHTWLLVYLLGSHTISAQQCDKTLVGKVIDFHDGVPLEGATIQYNDKKVQTDAQGDYVISGLCTTSYAFTISHENCNTQVVTLNMNEVASKDFYLEHHYTDLDEVDVASSIRKTTNSQVEERLSREQLDNYSNLSIGDALGEISGVSTLNSGNTIVKPVIQGLHSSRIIILNNGVRQEDQEWGEEHAPNMDINAFNQLKVIKGAGALQYGGNAIGGVIIAENKLTTLQDTIFGNAQLFGSTNGRGGTASTTLNLGFKNGWSAKVQGTGKYYGDSEAPDYVLSNTGINEQSFSTSFGFREFIRGFEGYYSFYNSTQGILRAAHIGNVGDLVRSINSNIPLFLNDFTYNIDVPRQETQHHLLKVKGYHRFKNLGRWNAQYSLQFNNRKEFDVRRGDNRDIPALDLDLLTHGFESNFLFDANDDFQKNVGFQASYQVNTPDPDTGIRRLIPDYEKFAAGIFAITDFVITDQLKGDVGVRYDFVNIDAKKFYKKDFWEEREYDDEFADLIIEDTGNQWLTNPVFDYHSVSGTVGLNYSYGENNEVLINLSYANRAPNAVELFSDGLHHGAAIIELGDLSFDQESALKLSLNQRHTFGNFGTLSIAPHLSSIDNFILLQPIGVDLTIRGAFPVWEYQQTNAMLYGIDVDYYIDMTKNLRASTSFSYIYGQDADVDQPLINMPAPNFRTSVTYQKNQLNLRLVNTSVLKQNRFPDNDYEVSYIENNEEVLEMVKISETPSAYTVFDLSGSYAFSLKTPDDLTVGFSISNVFNTSYRDYLNRQRFYVDNAGRNFTLNINLKF